MRTILAVADPVCLDALRHYADALVAAGLPVRMEEVPVDDGWTHETTVCIDWGPTEEDAYDWECDEDDGGGEEDDARDNWAIESEDVRDRSAPGLDDGPSRLAEHYLRTMRFLAGNVDAARATVSPARRSRKKK